MKLMNDAIEKALETWNFGKDPFHVKLKLAGESGEILDLYGKHLFKPGFSMWDCAVCKSEQGLHTIFDNCLWCEGGGDYTPLILDELGDYWYYLRLLFHIYGINIPEYNTTSSGLEGSLIEMNFISADILRDNYQNETFTYKIKEAFGHLKGVLYYLGPDLDQITDLNYKKLKDGHGWK